MTYEEVVPWISAAGISVAMFLLGGVDPVTLMASVALFFIAMGYSLRLRRIKATDMRLVSIETELNMVKDKLEKIEKFLEE